MYYDRKIKYLDYVENGDKIRNAGFVKIETIDDSCNIQVNLSGFSAAENMQKDILISDGRRESLLGTVQLSGGRGSLLLKNQPAAGLGAECIPLEKLYAIKSPVSKNRELICIWNEQAGAVSVSAPENDNISHINPAADELTEVAAAEDRRAGGNGKEEKVKKTAEMKEQPEIKEQAEIKEQPETKEQPEIKEQSEIKEKELKIFIPERRRKRKEADNGENGDNRNSSREDADHEDSEDNKLKVQWMDDIPPRPTAPIKLFDDKWKQLYYLYPHIAPFQDEREYLSIGPNDFVILNQSYHKLVNNSFLLHGYYNYNHLILTRVKKRGDERYYVGVPGNFYEREKQVAIMFGFESFECRNEPAQEGEFGYYMIRVDI